MPEFGVPRSRGGTAFGILPQWLVGHHVCMTKRTEQWWNVLMAMCAVAFAFAAVGWLPSDWPFVATIVVVVVVVVATRGVGELVLRAARTRR